MAYEYVYHLFMDQNDAQRSSFGWQNVIRGSVADAPDALRVRDPYSASTSFQVFNKAGYLPNLLFNTAGWYTLRSAWQKLYFGPPAHHPTTYVLVATEVGSGDADGDGVADASDNCPLVATADQADPDRDCLGDACDNDDDSDGVADAIDNCLFVANPSRNDFDRDGVGDACDPDVDGAHKRHNTR